MNPFATHLPVLLACLQHTPGPVLELGSGWFSTPFLSSFATDRLVRTIESNHNWFQRAGQIATSQSGTSHRHQLIFVPNYDEAPVLDQFWDVVLLDHEPPPRRDQDAMRMRGHCRLMIGHDSQHPAYGFEEAFAPWSHRFVDSRVVPWTTVVSDESLDWLAEALQFAGGVA